MFFGVLKVQGPSQIDFPIDWEKIIFRQNFHFFDHLCQPACIKTHMYIKAVANLRLQASKVIKYPQSF